MEAIKSILILIAIVLVSNALAFLVSTSRGAPMVKPFNCYGCLAFWFTLIFGAGYAYMQADALTAYVVLISAFLNYYYVKSKYNVTL